MKKTLSVILALCLLCCSALAENNVITNESTSKEAETLVSYTIDPCKEYTVTIPASVTIGDSQTATMTLSVDTSEYQLNPGNKSAWFYVFMSTDQYGFEHPEQGTMYYVTNGTDRIGYTILSEFGGGSSLLAGGKPIVLSYEIHPIPNETLTDTSTLSMTAYPIGTESPGEYTATLTFEVEVGEGK